jgi:hypothetical protein
VGKSRLETRKKTLVRKSNLGSDRRIILKWNLKEQDARVWSVFIWLRLRCSGGSCEYGNEPSETVKAVKYISIERLSAFQGPTPSVINPLKSSGNYTYHSP